MGSVTKAAGTQAPTLDAGNAARMRAAGMYGLLSEILGSGALHQRYGTDSDLIDRVKMACQDQERAMAAASNAPLAVVQVGGVDLSDSQIDALDTFALHAMAPQGKQSVRDFARAVLASAGPASTTTLNEARLPGADHTRAPEVEAHEKWWQPGQVGPVLRFNGDLFSASAIATWANGFPEVTEGEPNASYITTDGEDTAKDLLLAIDDEDTRVQVGDFVIRMGGTFRILRLAQASDADGTANSRPSLASNWVWRHVKSGGEYELIGNAKVQTDVRLGDLDEVYVYQGKDGNLWVRPVSEFND